VLHSLQCIHSKARRNATDEISLFTKDLRRSTSLKERKNIEINETATIQEIVADIRLLALRVIIIPTF
jgi:hypothetical protein